MVILFQTVSWYKHNLALNHAVNVTPQCCWMSKIGFFTIMCSRILWGGSWEVCDTAEAALPGTVKFNKRRSGCTLGASFVGGGDRVGCVHHMMDRSFPQILGFPCVRDKHWW